MNKASDWPLRFRQACPGHCQSYDAQRGTRVGAPFRIERKHRPATALQLRQGTLGDAVHVPRGVTNRAVFSGSPLVIGDRGIRVAFGNKAEDPLAVAVAADDFLT